MQRSTRSKSRTSTNPQEKMMIENEESTHNSIRSDKEKLNMKKESSRIETHEIEPNQIMILISRLRQERDELRCAVKFLNIEQSSLLQTDQNTIFELREELKRKDQINELQRNELVLALALVRGNRWAEKKGDERRRCERCACGDLVTDVKQDQDLMQIDPSHEPTELQSSMQEKSTSEDSLSSPNLVHELNRTISDLQSQVQTNGNLLETREIELQSIQQQLSVSQSNVTSYQIKINDLEEVVTQLKNQVIEHQTHRSELENDLVSLKSKLQDQNTTSDHLDHQAQDTMIEELNQTKTSLSETLNTVSELKEARLANESAMEEIEKHCATLCVQLQQKSDELIQAEGRLKLMKIEIEEVNEQHDRIRADLSEQLEIKSIKVEDLEKEKKAHREALKDGILELKSGIQDFKTEEQRLACRLDLHEDVKFELEQRSKKLSEELSDAYHQIQSLRGEKEEDRLNLEAKVSEMRFQIEEIQQENQRLIQQLNSHEEHNQQLEMIRNELSNQLALSTAKLTDHQNEKEEVSVKMKGRIRELSVMVDELRNEKEKLVHLPDLIDQINLQHERIRDELTERLGLLSTELVEVQNQKEEIRKGFEVEIELQKTRVEELEKEVGSSKETSDLNQTALEDLGEAQKESEGLRESMVKMEKEKEESCKDLQEEVRVQKMRVEELEAELISIKESWDGLKQTGSEDLVKVRKELESMREVMVNVENEKEESCSTFQFEIQAQRIKVEELETELKSTRDALKDFDLARAELEGLRESMTNLENQKEESRSALQLEIEAQKMRVEELEMELKSTRATLDSKQTVSEDLDQARTELEGLRESMANLENQKEASCSALQVEIEAQKIRVEEIEIELESTRETLDSKQTALEDLDQARAELEVLRESMTNVQNQKEESCSALQVEIQAQKMRVEELESELKSTREASEGLKRAGSEDLEQTRAELEGLRESMSNLQDEKEESCSALQVEIQAQKTRVEELEAELESTRESLGSKQTVSEELDQARVELEGLRESMNRVQNEKEESCSALLVEIQAQKTKVEELEAQLDSTRETLDSKLTALKDLDQARVELEILRDSSDSQSKRYNEAQLELERLRVEIVELKVQQGLNDELAKEFDVLVAEFELHHNKLQQSMDETQALRDQVEEYSRTKHALLSDLEEKNTLINSLKADLATMSKLHRNAPSSVELTEKINDLETRLMAKTDEAEDAMDRLIDQMQKNKQLTSMVENLKVKIKTKEKIANHHVKDEPKQEPKPSMTFPSELESEPIPASLPAPSPASRKRKLGYVANPINSTKLNSNLNPVIDAKENPTSISENNLPRKTILHPKLVNQEMNQEIQRNESQPLQVKSVNVNPASSKTEEEEGTRRNKMRERTDASSKPGSTTSAHLLASIQSLRKKQQQQKQAQLGNSGESGSTGTTAGNLMGSRAS